MNKLKGIVKCFFCIALFFEATSSWAEPIEVEGEVSVIRSHDLSVHTDWMSLVGVASVGSCVAYGGQALFYFRDDERGKRQLALATAAKMAGKRVRVSVDDGNSALVFGNRCYIMYLDLF